MSDKMSFKVKNLGSVTKNISKLLTDSIENGLKVQRDISKEVLARVATLTPVDTGRATANWRVKLNEPEDRAFPYSFDKSAVPFKTINAGVSVLNKSKKGDTIFISNNVASSPLEGGYILKLENGASQQAPNGMVRLAVDTTIVSYI